MIICNPGIIPKNKHIQSILASSKIRLIRLLKNNPIKKNSQEVLLKTNLATLQGFISKQTKSKDLYILLHGWEGSSHSTYIQLLANVLYRQKKATIFRLNFRDHGKTHHLNEGLFHSCRLQEVVDSIKLIIKKYPHNKINLCGFSLGANFSLRIASMIEKENIAITKVFAISPPLVPENSMKAIENSVIYAKYFMKKWKKSLRIKQTIYPQIFIDSNYEHIKSLEELTKVMILSQSGYKTTHDYFQAYKITEQMIKNTKVPCHVMTSWDDPVIPFDDFALLEKKKNIKLVTSKHGGHCGFINNWKMQSWVEKYIIENS